LHGHLGWFRAANRWITVDLPATARP